MDFLEWTLKFKYTKLRFAITVKRLIYKINCLETELKVA